MQPKIIYEVLTRIGTKFENVWSLDGAPQTFESEEAAFDAIEEHYADLDHAAALGMTILDEYGVHVIRSSIQH